MVKKITQHQNPPTERQLEYAKKLGVSISPDLSENDISDLISLKLTKDKASDERHRAFARLYGVECTEYIGKKALFDRIQAELILPGREKKLLSWFAYRVYRELIKGIDDAPIKSPDDPVIVGIAEKFILDEKILKSVRRYEGRDLIWFGEWTAPDGSIHSGGSNRTEAFKQVSLMLKNEIGLAAFSANTHIPSNAIKKSQKKVTGKNSGCLSLIVIGLPIITFLFFSASWIDKIL